MKQTQHINLVRHRLGDAWRMPFFTLRLCCRLFQDAKKIVGQIGDLQTPLKAK
jgi:hypothetical protein